MALALLAWAAALPAAAAPASTAPRHILFFTKSSNFEHSVIKRRHGEPSFAERALAATGPQHGFAFTFSKDGSLFSADYLKQFDAVMFYTSGDLLAPGKDGEPAMTPAGKAALLAAIRHGLGFVGVHSAADTFHTGETVETDTNRARTWRYRFDPAHADPYVRMLGGELIVHGTQQLANAAVVDRTFPGFAQFGPTIERMEEWYSLTNFAPDLHVLLLLDTSAMHDPNANGTDWPPAGWDTPYQRPPYPVTWARLEGEGRVFYTVLGHREDTWLDRSYQDMLFGGLAWAAHVVDADAAPNLAQVAPGADQLPPVSAPVSGLPKPLRAQLERLEPPTSTKATPSP